MPSQSFGYGGGSWQKFTVPKKVQILTINMKGAGSDTVRGGHVVGKMKVDPGDDLWILCGQQGQANGDPTTGGGGRGGDGHGVGSQAWSGGGGTIIRRGTRSGRIAAVAGGAGGKGGGPGNNGGRGGSKVGEAGKIGSDGSGEVRPATGGTQSQGGRGGSSYLCDDFYGRNGRNEKFGRGGAGGTYNVGAVHGGGGGGGGFYPGGGGAAGRPGKAPAGGGGAGANFVGGLYSASTQQGGGEVNNGSVVIRWDDPSINPPNIPKQDLKIDGKRIRSQLPTKAKHSVTVTGHPNVDGKNAEARLVVWSSRNKNFSHHKTWKGTYDKDDERDKVVLRELKQNTLYYLRIYTQDHRPRLSRTYRSTSFWTNRNPLAPELQLPAENALFTNLVNVTFTWKHRDPDPKDGQSAYRIRYRKARTPAAPPGKWFPDPNKKGYYEQATGNQSHTFNAGTFAGNYLYEWQVKTRDQAGDRWGPWAESKSFFVTASTSTPVPIQPIENETVVATDFYLFRWQFRNPVQGKLQSRADLQYRVADTTTWIGLFGTVNEPGAQWEWNVPPDTFEVGFQYEWQVRTYAVGDAGPSDWSESAFFWAIPATNSGPGILLPSNEYIQPPLGIGNNRVFIYDRGGEVPRGEITPLSTVQWTRVRDDISSILITSDSWTRDGRELLGTVRTWQHELVVFRDGVRVAEGPITRIAATRDSYTIEAKDVMGYVYRRAMRQGYNNTYRVVNRVQYGQRSVVEIATIIVQNALAYDDPNVLQYLTPLNASGDAKNSRIVTDYQKSAWDEIDDMAATAGLDYVCSGRRILFWDTHNAVGRLPELRDGDFSEPPVITEYGMSAANHYAVTNNDNIYAISELGITNGDPGPTGWIEQVVSAFGESDAKGNQRNLTRAARRRAREKLQEQADTGIAGHWPPPVVVRVPDNSTLNPNLNLGINQLVPGVWVPLRVETGIRSLSQWQKLDTVTVRQEGANETIAVTMSPAPQGGEDFDAEPEGTGE